MSRCGLIWMSGPNFATPHKCHELEGHAPPHRCRCNYEYVGSALGPYRPLAPSVLDGTLFFDGDKWWVASWALWYKWLGPIPKGEHAPGALFPSAVIHDNDGTRLRPDLR